MDFCEGEIGTSAFDYGAESIACAAESTGESIGEIEGREIVVDFFHLMEKSFGFGEISGAHLIEDEPAHFGGAFTHSV